MLVSSQVLRCNQGDDELMKDNQDNQILITCNQGVTMMSYHKYFEIYTMRATNARSTPQIRKGERARDAHSQGCTIETKHHAREIHTKYGNM